MKLSPILYCLALATPQIMAQDAPKSSVAVDRDVHHDPSTWLMEARESNQDVRQGLLYERWNDVHGKSVTYGRMMSQRKALPTAKGLVADLSTLPNDGKHYMTRLRGWVVAPKTGTYLLVLSADDNAELWLSSSESQFDKKRLAWITGEGWFGYSNPEESRRINSQRATVKLKEGQKYYIEVWHKESTGDDHLSVKWWYEKDRHSKPLSRENLIAWNTDKADQDDNGLPDDWQKKFDLTDDSDAWDDSDGDGVNNFDELKANTDPKDPHGVQGSLLWETWFGFGGNQVVDFTTYGRTRFAADRAVFLKGSSIPVEYGSNCAYRLSGYVTPQESGDYQFAITGDDSTELWLSKNDDPAQMTRIAFSDRRRGNFNWTAVASQQSVAIPLEANQSYFLQVLCKNGRNEGRAELGWRRKGEKKFASIAPEFLKSPNLRENDKDRNRLDDQWVAQAVRSDLAKQAKLEWISEWGDPDRDGINNRLEFLNGSNPMVAKSIAGKLTRQWWFNVPGQSLTEERILRAKLNKPSMVTLPDQGARLERNTTDSYLSRSRGHITAPVTGAYRFWIAADDVAELWLSSDNSKYQKKLIASVGRGKGTNFLNNGFTAVDSWDQYSQQQSKDIQLEAGQTYFIEILHKENGGDDHVSVAWSYREKGAKNATERTVIPSAVLSAFVIDADDRDDDYLPDAWEKEYKLSTSDNGARDYAKQGENGDFDGDDLTNFQEFLLGINPALVDTDGDGVSDGIEVNLYGSNPSVKDASAPVMYGKLPMNSFKATPGQWLLGRDGSVVSTQRRGPVDFSFDVDEPGIYIVEVETSAHSATSYVAPIPFITTVNHLEVGRGVANEDKSKFVFMTQWLQSGKHVITINNRNLRAGSSLAIHQVNLLRHEGADANLNHIPDWMENLFQRNNQITSSELGSLVSPAFIEGYTRLPGNVSITTTSGEDIAANSGIGNGWYANVSLSPSEETGFHVTFENGSISHKRAIRWEETNLFDAPGSMKVRSGDSLKLCAYVNDGEKSYTLFCNGEKLSYPESANHIVYTFDKPGIYDFRASASGEPTEAEAALQVEVVTADFGKTFSVASGSTRTWKLPLVPKELFIQADATLELAEHSTNQNDYQVIDVTSYATLGASSRVLARLYEGGPVVAASTVESFYFAASTVTNNNSIIRILPDGTRVVRSVFAIDGKIPDDLSIWIEMYVTDTVFANGDSWYELTAADFDENGEAVIEFYKSPGSGSPFVCHWIRPFMNDEEQDEVN